MIQFKVLSGKHAGATYPVRRFPVRLGRSAGSDLQLEDDGVWDQHLFFEFQPAQGIILRLQSEALATVNGEPTGQVLLRNGDIIGIGLLKVQFWLGETRQASLRLREWLTWLGIAGVSIGQIGLVYWLLP